MSSGDHLCEVSAAMYGSRPAVSGTELPSHSDTQSYDPGREVSVKIIYAALLCQSVSGWK